MTENLSALATKIDWSSLSGTILEGGYELKEALDARENAAKLSVRILGSGGKTATAYFMHLEPADGDDQIDIWNTLREAPHPNLSRPVAVGRHRVGSYEVVYLVLADPDERLAAVVPERPLEWEEAAEVLHSCEKGLAHLHAHGLIHGSVSPATVEAIGYSVLLSTESVHRIGKTPRVIWNKPQYLAPESKNLNLTTAADVWCLGATLFEVLTQERYGTPGVEVEKDLPLAAVILRCLDRNPLTRCTLKEAPSLEQAAPEPQSAATVVEPRPAQPPPPPPPVVEQAPPTRTPPPSRPAVDYRAAAPPPQPPPPRSAPPSSRIPNPLTPKAPPRAVTKEDMALVPVGKRHRRVQRQPVGARIRTLDAPEDAPLVGESSSTALGPPVAARVRNLGNRSSFVRNAIAALGLFLLFVAAIWFIIIPKLQSTEQPITSAISAQTATDSGSVDSSTNAPLPLPVSPPPTVEPKAPETVPSAETRKDSVEPSILPIKPHLYRVILGSYASREDALKERDSVATSHPELLLQVGKMKLETSADPKFVVAVGGVLAMGDAGPLRDRLVKKGLTSARLESVQR